ncbi:putative transcriptional regulatory protein Aasi_0624 [Ciona intestinalis]
MLHLNILRTLCVKSTSLAQSSLVLSRLYSLCTTSSTLSKHFIQPKVNPHTVNNLYVRLSICDCYWLGSVLTLTRGYGLKLPNKQTPAQIKAANDKARLYHRNLGMVKRALKESGGYDLKLNTALARAVAQCKKDGMPATLVNRLLDRKKQDTSEFTIPVTGPNGCVVILQCYAKNIKVAVQQAKFCIRKSNFQGSVNQESLITQNFERKGIILTSFPTSEDYKSEEEYTDLAIEVGAEDVSTMEDGKLRFTCSLSDWKMVEKELKDKNITVEYADVEYVPNFPVEVSDDQLEAYENLIQLTESVVDKTVGLVEFFNVTSNIENT